MIVKLGAHTVTVLRPPGNDAFGDPVGGDPAETEVTGAFMQPVQTSERTDDRDTVEASWTCFLPPDTDLRPTDQIRFRGLVYEVDGEPQPFDTRTGVTHHIEVRLRRVTG
ncbi:hypothetical protein [Streptomyces sp. HGB0020]|uniref:hypothetical protein n=1 Tax=Streptomyces sp. HGB0020 TaxID=1078086 RepID=UPI00034E77A3|nr:hypothetical protein [Streptomyces sp. HGB0020]EPD63175.1 hypothetical protein HMPREF1211_03516 [Streptomyces sp. HGB0020]